MEETKKKGHFPSTFLYLLAVLIDLIKSLKSEATQFPFIFIYLMIYIMGAICFPIIFPLYLPFDSSLSQEFGFLHFLPCRLIPIPQLFGFHLFGKKKRKNPTRSSDQAFIIFLSFSKI